MNRQSIPLKDFAVYPSYLKYIHKGLKEHSNYSISDMRLQYRDLQLLSIFSHCDELNLLNPFKHVTETAQPDKPPEFRINYTRDIIACDLRINIYT
jgi:hypothetical protein